MTIIVLAMLFRSSSLLAGLVAVVALFAGACSINPATGRRQLSLISEAQEIALGRDNDAAIVARFGLYPDDELQQWIQELGAAIAAVSERPDLPWTFRLLDDPLVNAFALPGGFIYVTRGILGHLNSEAELVGVLGHEIGHVTARHGANQLSKSMLAQLGLGVGMVADPEHASQWAQLGQVGLGLLFLKYGRDDERQADSLGVVYALRCDYDAREIPGVFRLLERVSRASGNGDVPGWLSTHPSPESRVERLEAEIRGSEVPASGLVRRQEYLHRLEGLVYGNNPRHGFFRDEHFYHPDMAFEMRFPSGWSTSNQRTSVSSISTRNDALLRLTLASEGSPEEASNRFFAQASVRADVVEAREIHGLAAVVRRFSVSTENGQTLFGLVAFVDHHDQVFELLALATQAGWEREASSLRAGVTSFQPLTDSRILEVQPRRIAIVALPRPGAIEEAMALWPGASSVEELALLNNVDRGARLESGTLLKTLVGGASLP